MIMASSMKARYTKAMSLGLLIAQLASASPAMCRLRRRLQIEDKYLDLVGLVLEDGDNNRGITFDSVAEAIANTGGFTDDERYILRERMRDIKFNHGYAVVGDGVRPREHATDVQFIQIESSAQQASGILGEWTFFNLHDTHIERNDGAYIRFDGDGNVDENDLDHTGIPDASNVHLDGWDVLKDIFHDEKDILALFRIKLGTKRGTNFLAELQKRVRVNNPGTVIDTDTIRQEYSMTEEEITARDNEIYPDSEQAKAAAQQAKAAAEEAGVSGDEDWDMKAWADAFETKTTTFVIAILVIVAIAAFTLFCLCWCFGDKLRDIKEDTNFTRRNRWLGRK